MWYFSLLLADYLGITFGSQYSYRTEDDSPARQSLDEVNLPSNCRVVNV